MNSRLTLFALILCAFLAGCGQDEYAIEREYYHAQKDAAAVASNPEAVPPLELKRVVDTLGSFAVRYPGTNVALDAQFTVARLYVVVKQYAKGQEEFTRIGQAYAKSEQVNSEVLFLSGVAYEEQGDWNAALKQYNTLMKSYPRTPRGLEVPLHIALRYKSKLQPENMMDSLREAVTHYENLALQAPGTQLALQARMLAAQSYSGLEDWKDAVKTLEAIIKDFKDKIQTEKIQFQVVEIYAGPLKDPAAAKDILNKLIAANPKGPVYKAATQMLKQLEKVTK
jgi:tetratricopeptide (TPR) repeat protein